MTARRWIRIPPDDPQATYQIAGLVALEAAVAIAARAQEEEARRARRHGARHRSGYPGA
jgi:hypothetical protein